MPEFKLADDYKSHSAEQPSPVRIVATSCHPTAAPGEVRNVLAYSLRTFEIATCQSDGGGGEMVIVASDLAGNYHFMALTKAQGEALGKVMEASAASLSPKRDPGPQYREPSGG